MKRASDTVAPTMHGAPLPTYALGAQLFWAGQFTLPASHCRGVSYSPPGSSWVTSYWSGEAGSGGVFWEVFPMGLINKGEGTGPRTVGMVVGHVFMEEHLGAATGGFHLGQP